MKDKKISGIVSIAICIVVAIMIVSVICFILTEIIMNVVRYKPLFSAGDVLEFYGTIIAGCIAGGITAIGLYLTLKQNNDNLKKEMKKSEEDYQKNLNINFINDAIFKIADIKANIANIDNHICNIKIISEEKYIDEILKTCNEVNKNRVVLEYFNNNIKYVNKNYSNDLDNKIKDINKNINSFLYQVNHVDLNNKNSKSNHRKKFKNRFELVMKSLEVYQEELEKINHTILI